MLPEVRGAGKRVSLGAPGAGLSTSAGQALRFPSGRTDAGACPGQAFRLAQDRPFDFPQGERTRERARDRPFD